MSDGSHEDGCLPVGGDGGLGAAHLADVPDQCIGSIAHATAVVGVHIDFYLVITVDEQVALLETDESLLRSCSWQRGVQRKLKCFLDIIKSHIKYMFMYLLFDGCKGRNILRIFLWQM